MNISDKQFCFGSLAALGALMVAFFVLPENKVQAAEGQGYTREDAGIMIDVINNRDVSGTAMIRYFDSQTNTVCYDPGNSGKFDCVHLPHNNYVIQQRYGALQERKAAIKEIELRTQQLAEQQKASEQ